MAQMVYNITAVDEVKIGVVQDIRINHGVLVRKPFFLREAPPSEIKNLSWIHPVICGTSVSWNIFLR